MADARARNLIILGMAHVPTQMRDQAIEATVLSAAGWKTQEIAKLMGINWHQVSTLRDEMGNGIIEALRDEGYSDVEVIRTLGIPTARMPTE